MNMIEHPENLELHSTIILNGHIEYCDTNDENEETIGVVSVKKVQMSNGREQEIIESFPFTKEMEQRCGWRSSYASIQMLTGNLPIDIQHIDKTKIVSMMGEIDSEYYHRYSEYTGYLWTDENFKCGGHDIKAILESHIGEYIYMEIALYRPTEED